jgi:flagellar hook protein FlgE
LYDPASGLAVQGYTANANGQITASGNPGTIQIPLGLSQQATATGGASAVKLGPGADKNFDMSIGGSLDVTQFTQEQNAPGTGTPKILTTTVYDSLGNAHQATLVFSPDPTADDGALPATLADSTNVAHNVSSRYKMQAYFTDGTQINGAATSKAAPVTLGYAFFDTNGQFINTSGAFTGATVHNQGSAPAAAAGNLLNITSFNTPTPPTPPNTANNAAIPQNVGLDFANLSALAGVPTANVIAQDGYAAGILSNITVGQDGTVTGSFTNGQQKSLAQVALATFQNEGGLQRVSGGFQQTANSGLAQFGSGNSGRFGGIIAGSLEQSNVSLADEFTKMIVAQRAFEANSRTISTADQNLQTSINIRASEN